MTYRSRWPNRVVTFREDPTSGDTPSCGEEIIRRRKEKATGDKLWKVWV